MARWPAQASVFDLMVASDQTGGSPQPVWKSKFYGAFVLNRCVLLHAYRRATPARWRGGARSSPRDRASTARVIAAGNDLVKNCRVHPAHWLISTQAPAHAHHAARAALACRCRQQRYSAACEEEEHRLHGCGFTEMLLSPDRCAGVRWFALAQRAHQLTAGRAAKAWGGQDGQRRRNARLTLTTDRSGRYTTAPGRLEDKGPQKHWGQPTTPKDRRPPPAMPAHAPRAPGGALRPPEFTPTLSLERRICSATSS